MKKIIQYLHLDKVGLFELLFALYPILAGYSYGKVHLAMIVPLVLAFTALFLKRNRISVKEYYILILFCLIHEVFLIFITGFPGFLINKTISFFLMCIFLQVIVAALSYEKMIGAINIVAIASIIGMIYHYVLIFSGSIPTPIKLPFLPNPDQTSRLYEELFRPTSFFGEPASYATFMFVPLFLSLYERKYIWAAVITVSLFLSTSSTGIIMSLIMWGIYFLNGKMNMGSRIVVILIVSSLCFFLVNSDLFTEGIDKISNTEIESSSRLYNGGELIKSLSLQDLLFGIPAADITEYYRNGGISNANLLGDYSVGEELFIPAFYYTWAKYGIIGVLLYLYLFYALIRKCKEIAPYALVVFGGLFFQCISVGSATFVFQVIFMYVFCWTHRLKVSRN